MLCMKIIYLFQTLCIQVDETKTESEYQLRLKDNKFAEESKAASKKFENDLAKMSQTINRLQVWLNFIMEWRIQRILLFCSYGKKISKI